jgi:D-arabinose 1-dehydrogenase-like Zn-dependent alcohol dehydrogenase
LKAAFIRELGTPEKINFGEFPEPSTNASQVLVRVNAVAVNPIDTYIRRGAFAMKLTFPFIIGRDMVGIVEAAGVGVRQFSAGDRVWCNNQGYGGRQGTFAEYLVIDEKFLYPLPAGADGRPQCSPIVSGWRVLYKGLLLARFRHYERYRGRTAGLRGIDQRTAGARQAVSPNRSSDAACRGIAGASLGRR